MCIVTTSYPCPEGDLAELLQRISNTRKIVPCDTVSSLDGRRSSCAGGIKVQHHRLGESEFCSSCSLAAKAAYSETREGREKKRKAEGALVDEGNEQDVEERMAKKAKTSEMIVTSEVGLEGAATEATHTGSDTLLKTVSAVDQAVLVDIAKEVVDPQEIQEAPVVGRNLATELSVAGRAGAGAGAGAGEPIEVAFDTPKKTLEKTETLPKQTGHVPTTQEPRVDLSHPTEEHMSELEEGVETVDRAEEEQRYATSVTVPMERAKKNGKPNGEGRVAMPGPKISRARGAEHSGLSEFEQVQSLILKMNQKQIKAEKDWDDVLRRNATLVAQVSQYQDEIAALQTRLSEQNAQHQAEMEKQKDAGKGVGAEKAARELEKQDLEAKVGRLVQKNDELAKAASSATDETNAVKARVRGQQNRVAELEGQMAIMKQVEDGRKKQLEEARGQNEAMQRQVMGFRTKTAGFEAETARLKQGMAAVEEENLQLRAAVVQRVLSTPMSQGPAPSPLPALAQAPADDSVMKSQEDVKVEKRGLRRRQ